LVPITQGCDLGYRVAPLRGWDVRLVAKGSAYDLHAESVTQHSPGSRSAPWVTPRDTSVNPERVAQIAIPHDIACGTPLGYGEHVDGDRNPGWRGVTAADPGLC
jgi:hypothetical protein